MEYNKVNQKRWRENNNEKITGKEKGSVRK